MEKGLGEEFACLKRVFELNEVDLRTYSPLTLAYVGDGIYGLIIRTVLAAKGNMAVHKLNKEANSLVRASAQAAIVEIIKPAWTEEEQRIYKKGRNAKLTSVAKNATMIDYRRATGLETLMGFLYLRGDMQRMLELIQMGLKGLEKRK